MAEFEHALRALGQELEWPPEPRLAPAVAERLRADARQQRRPSFRPLALAFGVLVAAFAVAMAVPPARSAILDFFGIGGVEIRRVETVPQAGAPLPLGEQVSLEEALERTDFGVALPRVPIEAVYVDERIPGGRVSFVWHENGRRIVLSEFEGRQTPYFQKQVGPGTSVTQTTFRGTQAVWISGRTHSIVYADRDGMIHDEPRRAGNVMLWELGRTTFRLEGAPTQRRAFQILGTIGPFDT